MKNICKKVPNNLHFFPVCIKKRKGSESGILEGDNLNFTRSGPLYIYLFQNLRVSFKKIIYVPPLKEYSDSGLYKAIY